jgi:hypothetical protein
LTGDENKALGIMNSSIGAVRKSLRALEGSLVVRELEGDETVYRFKHPTIRDAFGGLRGRLKNNLNLVLVLFMAIIDKAWDEHNRTIPERFHQKRMEADQANVARPEQAGATAAIFAA